VKAVRRERNLCLVEPVSSAARLEKLLNRLSELSFTIHPFAEIGAREPAAPNGSDSVENCQSAIGKLALQPFDKKVLDGVREPDD
jgi:hypothetical protein